MDKDSDVAWRMVHAAVERVVAETGDDAAKDVERVLRYVAENITTYLQGDEAESVAEPVTSRMRVTCHRIVEYQVELTPEQHQATMVTAENGDLVYESDRIHLEVEVAIKDGRYISEGGQLSIDDLAEISDDD